MSGLLDRATALTYASWFRALADPTRVQIVEYLARQARPMSVGELVAAVGLAQSTVSQHLACLRDCGLVDVRPVGRASVYRVARPDAVLALLAGAERLLAATGDQVTLCPTQTEGR